MSSRYSIKDLERISGIKAHTLRIWEQRYKVLSPARTTTNIRYYNDADLRRILNVSLLNNHGFKISNIARLSSDAILHEVEKLLNSYKKESDQVDNLMLCLMDLDEKRFDKTVNDSITHFGFENAIENVIFPFLKHIGNLWQTGVVSAAQEHYISNLIRQKLIVGIDKLVPLKNNHPKHFLFFLPNTELHELGLLYIYYLAKVRGHKCVYLGQSVPLDDLASITENVKPDCLVTIFTVTLPDTDLNLYLKSCSEKIPDTSFLFSGRLIHNEGEKLVLPNSNFQTFENFEGFKKLL